MWRNTGTLWGLCNKFLPLWWGLKARLHKRFLSRQLDAIFVAPKLHQVSNMFETPGIPRRHIALRIIAPGLHMRFWSCNSSATKIASSCRVKNRLCKRAFTLERTRRSREREIERQSAKRTSSPDSFDLARSLALSFAARASDSKVSLLTAQVNTKLTSI